jgi:hypothetical protein
LAHRCWFWTALGVVLIASSAGAEPRPALDDFYDRSRSRAHGFTDCLGHCDGQSLAAFLVGAQVADPSTDAVQRALAYGGRLGVDLGVLFGRYDIARTKLWADVLHVDETDDTITDLAWQSTWFFASAEPGEAGVQLGLDTLLTQRTELEPSDVAQFQLVPYRAADIEFEVAPVGAKIDKDAFVALPFGVARRVRWNQEDDQTLERRTTLAGAFALRGFPSKIAHHYQFDMLRVKRTFWEVPGGDASAWTISAGYQRLSPDVEWLQIWLLGGYAWHAAAEDRNGFVWQLGAETAFPTKDGRIEVGPMYEAHFALDQGTARFSRVHEFRLYYRHTLASLHWGLSYHTVDLEKIATLHALTPQAGVLLLGMDLTARYRISFLRDERFAGAAQDRFNFSADWIF